MNPYILGPVFGALAGAFMGWLMNERSILGTATWIPGFVLMGILWGISVRRKVQRRQERGSGKRRTAHRNQSL